MEIEQADQLDELKEAMVNFICQDKEANLQNIQQINDIETFKERKKIIEDALELNHISFLSRFRKSLKPNHLKFFELQTYPPEMQFDINFYLKEITLEFKNRDTIIKNRRFGALTKLIEDKKYFSVDEMKLRNPLLYNQLVDRYLSADERRAYNRPNPRTDTLTDILLKGIDRDYMQDLEKKQIEEEGSDSEDSSNDSESREQFPKQWGNFEENSNPIDQPSTSHPRKRIKKTKAITSEERSLLKDEFLGIMYASFLEGKDDFDYSTVDNNAGNTKYIYSVKYF